MDGGRLAEMPGSLEEAIVSCRDGDGGYQATIPNTTTIASLANKGPVDGGPDLLRTLRSLASGEVVKSEDAGVAHVRDAGYSHNEDTEEMREDVKSLQKNTLELCRKMKAVPSIVQELRNFQDRESRPAAMIQFLKTLADMQELTLKRLSTTVEEEKSRQELLEHYKSREAEASTRRQQLDTDLRTIRRECERAQSHRNEILTKLKADLINVKDTKKDKMDALKNKYDQRMNQHQETFEAKRDELQKKINALLESNKKLKAQSWDEEMDQIRKAKRYETDVDLVITKYDTEVKELAKNYSENAEHLKKEQRQLADLREHFEKVEEENACIQAEEALVAARKKKLDDEKRLKNEMAAMLQAYWRGILKREEYVAEKKKAKKKKGGKKK
ncbi:DRC10 [Symbiodinium natans]|uniref:Dynein regulatory complex protein 10 n=1 Tax=Symbiodinium natans TaxID=878477 RepID=A0A812JY69_9DINO|nr:DRC10 [Symbiodinium natans]